MIPNISLEVATRLTISSIGTVYDSSWPGGTIEGAEFAIGNAYVGVVENNVVDERYRVAEFSLPEDVGYEAH